LRLNYIGIIGGILAFISLALPWWTLTLSGQAMGIPISADFSVYPYKGAVSFMGFSMDIPMNVWFGSTALVLVILGGILGIVGSIILDKGKAVLAIGGVLTLLSIIVFATGLQSEFSKAEGFSIPIPAGGGSLEIPAIGLFSSGTWDIMGTTVNYSSYLSFGFWLALIAAIIIFAAVKKAVPAAVAPTPATPPPPPP